MKISFLKKQKKGYQTVVKEAQVWVILHYMGVGVAGFVFLWKQEGGPSIICAAIFSEFVTLLSLMDLHKLITLHFSQ
jgi:hypothetical protein